jgi:hypothetical protein
MFAATMLINAASMVTWLFPKQLVDRGFPLAALAGAAGIPAVLFASAALTACASAAVARSGTRRAAMGM